jgi:L-rhamnose isomerase
MEATDLGWELSNALDSDHPSEEVKSLLAEVAAEKLLVMSFPESMSLEGKVRVVRAVYAAMERQIDWVCQRIRTEMLDDPRNAALLRRYAILDSQSVVALKQEAHAQNAELVRRAVSTLYSSPHTSGIQFQYGLAYHQLVGAAMGINVFD